MSDCIVHTGYVGRNGYGQKKYRGRVVAAHRLAYAKANGLDVFTMGGSVLHSCDNPVCVNPEHLRLGTHGENMRDMVSRGRNKACRKLEEDEVARIREIGRIGTRHSPGNLNALASSYGVHRDTIRNVVLRKLYV